MPSPFQGEGMGGGEMPEATQLGVFTWSPSLGCTCGLTLALIKSGVALLPPTARRKAIGCTPDALSLILPTGIGSVPDRFQHPKKTRMTA